MCIDYNELHPCSIPYMTGEDGECSLLIETNISAQGPSRGIFMAYHLIISGACLILALQHLDRVNFELIVTATTENCFPIHPRLQGALLGAAGAAMGFAHGADPVSYGGRLPSVVTDLLRDQALFLYFAAMATTLGMWHVAQAPAAERALRERRVAIIKWCLIGVMGFTTSVLTVLEGSLRPADAKVGVYNGYVSLVKIILSTMVIVIMSGLIAWQYLVLRRKLQRGRPMRTVVIKPAAVRAKAPSNTVPSLRSPHWIRRSDTDLRREDKKSRELGSSDLKDTSGKHAETAMPAKQAHTVPMRRPAPAFHSEELSPTREESLEATLHQVTKFAALAIALFACCIIYTISMVYVILRDCWILRPPVDHQWLELPMMLQLLCSVAFALAEMKTHHFCRRGSSKAVVHPDVSRNARPRGAAGPRGIH